MKLGFVCYLIKGYEKVKAWECLFVFTWKIGRLIECYIWYSRFHSKYELTERLDTLLHTYHMELY